MLISQKIKYKKSLYKLSFSSMLSQHRSVAVMEAYLQLIKEDVRDRRAALILLLFCILYFLFLFSTKRN